MMKQEEAQRQFEFLPLTLSIETLGDQSTPLVNRGTPLPTERSQTFSTANNNQESVEIKVLFGERPLASKNLVLGSCLLKDLKPAPRGEPQIVVTFKVDKYCRVTVGAVEGKSGRKIEAQLVGKQLTLTDEIINRMVTEARENQQEDKTRSLMTSAELRIRKDQEANLVTETTRRIESIVSEIGVALMDGDKIFILEKTKELEKLLDATKVNGRNFAGFDDVFSGFFAPSTTRGAVRPQQKAAPSKVEQPQRKNPLAEGSTPTAPSGVSTSRSVFVVHGHDEAAKEAVARLLERLDLNPVILHDLPDKGKTIIEKLEAHAAEVEIGYAVVLLTPDDVGAIRSGKRKLNPRARQNVILELGFFMAKLGRARVCALHREGVELPSDYHGVLYKPLDSEGAWQLKLAKEIKAAGVKIDLNKLS